MNRRPSMPSQVLPRSDVRYRYARRGDGMVSRTRWGRRVPLFSTLVLLIVLLCVAPSFSFLSIAAGFILLGLLGDLFCLVPWIYDFRPPILVFRSFSDERTRVGEVLESTDFGPSPGRNPYIWQLTQAMRDWCRVIILQREVFEADDSLKLRAIVVEPDDNDWERVAITVARHCWLIIVFPSSSSGCIRELVLLRAHNLLSKTVVWMPPMSGLSQSSNGADHEKHWNQLREELRTSGFNLPEYNPQGMFYIPDSSLSIATYIDLHHNNCAWKRLPELIPNPSVSAKSLWNILCGGQAYEAVDPAKTIGGVVADEGLQAGGHCCLWSGRYCADSFAVGWRGVCPACSGI